MGYLPLLLLACVAHAAHGVRVSTDSDLGGDSPCPLADELAAEYERCSAALASDSVKEAFPLLPPGWCDQQKAQIEAYACPSTDRTLAEQALTSLTEVVAATAAEGPPDAYEKCGDRGTCEVCGGLAGVRKHIELTHVCEWRENACRPSSVAVKDLLAKDDDCQGSSEEKASQPPPQAGSLAELDQHSQSNRTSGRAFALLVAYTYRKPARLDGTYSDAKLAFTHLVGRGFHPSNIYVLFDEGHPADFVTRSGQSAKILPGAVEREGERFDHSAASFWEMMARIRTLNGFREGDFFLFWFSGHGGQTSPGTSHFELDGMDEFLYLPALDKLMDDDFYAFLVTLKAGVTMTAVIDACHSEGFSDLPLNYNPGRAVTHMTNMGKLSSFEAERTWCTDLVQAPTILPRARIVAMSGSQNAQTSGDAGIEFGGILSNYLLSNWHKAGTAGHEGIPKDLFGRMSFLLISLSSQGATQEPNVCAWPMLPDTQAFHPIEPPSNRYGTQDYRIDYWPFAGGTPPNARGGMLTPPLCRHGGREATAALAKRRHGGLLEQASLGDATRTYQPGDLWTGWATEYVLQLPPISDQDLVIAGDVVSFVKPKSAAAAYLRIGDVIRSVDGQPFEGPQQLKQGGQVTLAGSRP